MNTQRASRGESTIVFRRKDYLDVVVVLRDPRTGQTIVDDGLAAFITIRGDVAAYMRLFRFVLGEGRIRFDVLDSHRRELLRKIALATVAWRGIAVDGSRLACTPANARQLYADKRTRWVIEQLVEHIVKGGT